MKRALLTALLAGSLLALGATGVSSSAASNVVVTFGPGVQVSADDSQSAGEPSIRGALDGKIYIVAPQGLGSYRAQDNEGSDVIWRSEDGGATWTWLGSYDSAAGGGDADIAPNALGDLWGSGLTLANTTATYSADDGESWCVNPIGSLDTVVDRQWIETYKGEPFAFMTTGRIANSEIILSRLELAAAPGENAPGCPVVSNTIKVGSNYQWPGEIAVDETNDLVYTAFTTGDNLNDDVIVTRSSIDLLQTEDFVVTKTKGDTFDSFAAIDVDQAGNVYVVWSERRPKGDQGKFGLTHSMLSVSKDQGETWSKPKKVNSHPRTTVFPWVVAGSKGRVAVAYYGIRHRGASPEQVIYPTRLRIPKWKIYVAYSLNAHKATREFTEVRALKPFIHEGNICTSGTGCSSGTRDLLDFFQIDLTTCGDMIITYTDNSRDTVTLQGQRTGNMAELIGFVGQNSGPRLYKTPLDPSVC